MALKKFPRRIFRDTITLYAPAGFSRYQQPQNVTQYKISNVHVQADNDTVKTADNTEVRLKGKCWIYPPYASPMIDVEALQEQVQAAGGVLTCTIDNKAGRSSGPYTVLSVNGYPDDFDNLHHIMLEMV